MPRLFNTPIPCAVPYPVPRHLNNYGITIITSPRGNPSGILPIYRWTNGKQPSDRSLMAVDSPRRPKDRAKVEVHELWRNGFGASLGKDKGDFRGGKGQNYCC